MLGIYLVTYSILDMAIVLSTDEHSKSANSPDTAYITTITEALEETNVSLLMSLAVFCVASGSFPTAGIFPCRRQYRRL